MGTVGAAVFGGYFLSLPFYESLTVMTDLSPFLLTDFPLVFQEWVEVKTLKVDEGGRALITSQQLNVKLDFARFKIKVRRKQSSII